MDTSKFAQNPSAAQDSQNTGNTSKGAGGSGAYQKAIVIEVLGNPDEFDFTPYVEVEAGADPLINPAEEHEILTKKFSLS